MNKEGLFSECCSQLLDWIYPRNCEICGEGPLEGCFICEACKEALLRLPRPLCPICGGVVPGSSVLEGTCEDCRQEARVFDFARSSLIHHGELRELILTFKYRRGLYLGGTFAELMLPMMEEFADRLKGVEWTLVPVPVSRKKLMGRGFNQAEELARALSKQWGFPMVDVLQRRSDRISQTALDRRGRMKHVRELYHARESSRLKHVLEGKHILLIDDLFTTGSTANACATVLKKELHAASVGVLTLARAVSHELIPHQ